MSKGGSRANSGRKSKWKGEVERITLPRAYIPELVKLAERLDAGEISVSSLQSVNLPQEIEAVLLEIRPCDRRLAKRIFNRLIERLHKKAPA